MAHYRLLADYPLLFLTDTARFLDAQIAGIEGQFPADGDLDSAGYYDRVEHVSGLGFVAFQQYIASLRPIAHDRDILSMGPVHHSGLPMIRAIHECANYWKHSPEWREPLDKRAKRTSDTLLALGVNVGSSYVLSNALHVLLAPLRLRFESLLPVVEAWRNTVLMPSPTASQTP